MQESKLIALKRQAKKAGWYKDFTANDEHALLQGCYYDERAATKPIDWIESFCRLPSGPKAGQRVELLPWVKEDLVLPLYGWLRPNGLRRYKKNLTSIAKKNTKSTTCSALALYSIAGDSERGAYVYLTAVDKKQTKQVFHPAAEMVRASPYLAKHLSIIDSRLEIRKGTNAWISSLAADQDSSQGVDAYVMICDEKHAWTKPSAKKFASSLKYAQRSRLQPIWIDITTRGEDENSLYGEEEQYAVKVMKDEIIDIEMLPLIYAPQKDDPIDAPETWRKANPGIGYSVSLSTIEAEYKRAVSGSPSDMADFKRYILNLWQPGEEAFLNMSDWAECETKVLYEGIPDIVCGGVDLSSKEDLCSVAWVGKQGNSYFEDVRIWTPERKMLELVDKQDYTYKQWVSSGQLRLCPGDVIDQDMIYESILEDIQKYKPKEIAFDRFNADQLMRKLDLYKKNFVVQIPQNFKSVSEPMKLLKLLVMTKQFRHDGNACLTWQAGNLCKFDDHMGNVRYVRKGRKGNYYKIDAMVAIILALSRLIYRAEAKSAYEDPTKANPNRHLTQTNAIPQVHA